MLSHICTERAACNDVWLLEDVQTHTVCDTIWKDRNIGLYMQKHSKLYVIQHGRLGIYRFIDANIEGHR